MSLQQQIKSQMKEALLKKETVRLSVLRSLLAGFTNELVARGRKPQEEATDEEALSVIKRSVKQHKDSIEQFKAGGREDLVVDETAELMILETYLPMSMPKEEIKKVAEEVKTRLGVTDKAKMGQLVGAVMKELKGKANGGDVKAVVESLFS
ncbi:MAG: hypothetical protein A2836_01500 [Candidatus Taylorbacteria bacterium RIFCSPHIGHO2_01_FULL_45_63]|uniref:Glutamyl-tRNA amidotransferase n=1 Tax=Candidatus Taylorbacteria bacterium RIFCSPHIGHO2_02_FULL_45_35 TaxID=1802311 RepID=A0A1G2MW63_9BACT|nr:MAG: hypothetical protein A2836_01500 [Candidatus Taylorbacteria bacterium RIFCSPHIGHO2_01_FULL_45_63]OHA28085.1 MAG: hypothetical protein A3D56_00200 [Candidatus Taylorbacteria bacterium RIFCSPHIGHO2_02_FULL_45_35]OHA34911.1 MAG: hypothetical protein A3A22_03000 [Candidatus Taylorbacteria bacterium RIFCSPLOWO2_01_FULL_45_34b]